MKTVRNVQAVRYPDWARIFNSEVIAHFLFFSSLFFSFNPFIALSGPVKFGIYGTMLIAGLVISRWEETRPMMPWGVPAIAFIMLYAIALARIHYIPSSVFEPTFTMFIFMGVITILAFVTSCMMLGKFDIKLMRRCMLVAAVPCGISIIMNFEALSDITQVGSYRLGNLNYDSYQTTATILGIASLCALAEINTKKLFTWRNAGLFVIFAVFGYYVFQGIGRGEAIAFVIAVLLFVAPRISLMVAPFSYGLTYALVYSIDSPLTNRMRILFEGDLGARDILFGLSIEQIYENPNILFAGDGLNAFQAYWNLANGEYPHNIVLDALLSGGVLLTLALLIVYLWLPIRALVAVLKRPHIAENRYAVSLMIFILIIQLKSGSLLAAWALTTFTCLFLASQRMWMPAPRAAGPVRRPVRERQNG